MATQATDKAEIRFYDPQDCDVKIGALQQHGDRQAAVHCRVVEWTPERMVSLSYYDPGLLLPRHSHASDSLIYILDGEVEIGGRRCTPGTQIVLPKHAPIGPLIAGPEGCTFLESYAGDVTAKVEDAAGFEQLLAERGVTMLAGGDLQPIEEA